MAQALQQQNEPDWRTERTDLKQAMDSSDDAEYEYVAPPGINEEIVRQISQQKNEPRWMLEKRLQALHYWESMKMPEWGPPLEQRGLDPDNIIYYARTKEEEQRDWDNVDGNIRDRFEKLGIPQAEKNHLAGAGVQYESEVIYHNLKDELKDQGVIFENMDVAVRKYPDLVKQYFMNSCVPVNDHKFAALHGAVWSGGTFIYVPENVTVDMPLQAYFRMNSKQMGQFEHTLIIVEDGAEVNYIEGCSAPQYEETSLHAGCVEIFVGDNARCRYNSVENWSKNTFNLNTKRSIVGSNSKMEWIGGNIGSGTTMLYPCTVMKGAHSRAEHIAIAFAGDGQYQDTGAKIYHLAPHTSSTVISKSVCTNGGVTTYRGLIKVAEDAEDVKSNVDCDALVLDDASENNTYPSIDINNDAVDMTHEASAGKISEEKLFYLMSRGLDEEEAMNMVVNGFIEPITKELPLEYAVELNRLIQHEMEGSVG